MDPVLHCWIDLTKGGYRGEIFVTACSKPRARTKARREKRIACPKDHNE
jgi:hypothetical protein